jgi:hypothetical protein
MKGHIIALKITFKYLENLFQIATAWTMVKSVGAASVDMHPADREKPYLHELSGFF